MTILVRKPGLLTTIQDLGRYGYQKYGVVAAGAMDHYACAAANILVGNAESEAVLEMTMAGPALYFEQSQVIAICGADMKPQISGEPVPMWRPVYVEEGSLLRFGSAGEGEGCRGYLAVAGGFEIQKLMGSYATYLRASIGGFHGRALQAGDRLSVGVSSALGQNIAAYIRRSGVQKMTSLTADFHTVPWRVAPSAMPEYAKNPIVRFLPGLNYDLFDEESRSRLELTGYQVEPQSDRMGYRLSGPPLRLRNPIELLSEPVTFGTVQVPPDGNPIILMADRQTTGGYPVIVQIITADLPLVAQTPIGGIIRFRKVEMQEAYARLVKRREDLQLLNTSIRINVH